jgi:hypothetical protein
MNRKMNRMNRHKAVPANSTTNPIQILTNFPPMVETSVINQTQTNYELSSSGIISHKRRAADTSVRPAFGVIASIIIYAPGKPGPITAYDFAGASADGSPAARRTYTKLFQVKFGKGFHLAAFFLNSIPPIDGTQTLVFKHPPCKRRAILADQIVNVTGVDQQAFKSSNKMNAQINSGPTNETAVDSELVYGVIAFGGNFKDYIAPADYIPINTASSNVDEFDVSLRTYYKLTSTTGSFRIGATSTGDFQAAAAVQTFKALTL